MREQADPPFCLCEGSMTEAISEFLGKYGMEIATSYRTREDLTSTTLDIQQQSVTVNPSRGD